MKTLKVLALLMIFAVPAVAQLSVGDPAPTPDATATMGADNILTATGTMRFYGSTTGVTKLDVACNGSATFYLYDFDSSDEVRAVYGPFYTRSWAPVRSPLTGVRDADMIHVTSLSASEIIITPEGQ